jgi:hypothetical protein
MDPLASHVASRYKMAMKKNTDWTELQDETPDIQSAAEELHKDLQADPEDELGECIKKAEELVEHLESAVSCETEHDFHANLHSAHITAKGLIELLGKTKGKKETKKIVTEAVRSLKSIIKELHELAPEE